MTENATFKVRIDGPGLALERDVEQRIVLRLLQLLFGSSVGGANEQFQEVSGVASNETPAIVLRRSGANTNVAKITALGTFLMDVRGLKTFDARNVREVFVQSGEPIPRNLTRDINDAVRRGWLAPSDDGEHAWYVTQDGRDATASSAFAPVQRPRKKRAPKSSVPKGRTKRRHGPKQLLEGLMTEGFFDQPRATSDIVKKLAVNGYATKTTDFTAPLLALIQNRQLKRKKSKPQGSRRVVWIYTS